MTQFVLGVAVMAGSVSGATALLTVAGSSDGAVLAEPADLRPVMPAGEGPGVEHSDTVPAPSDGSGAAAAAPAGFGEVRQVPVSPVGPSEIDPPAAIGMATLPAAVAFATPTTEGTADPVPTVASHPATGRGGDDPPGSGRAAPDRRSEPDTRPEPDPGPPSVPHPATTSSSASSSASSGASSGPVETDSSFAQDYSG